jgi:hypothetical protein
LRRPGDPSDAEPVHVLVFATLGAPERRKRLQRKRRQAEPEPEPTLVTTGRATIVDVGEPFESEADAQAWLKLVDEDDLEPGLAVLNRALHAFRLVTADPYLHTVGLSSALVARIGYGAGEQVADGLWTDAVEITASTGRQRRTKVLIPQARLAAVLNGRERALACEELILRARLDLDHGRPREAALQVLVALDTALAEITLDPTSVRMPKRLEELRDQREKVTAAAQTALSGELDEQELEAVDFTVRRLEAVLRARAVINAE